MDPGTGAFGGAPYGLRNAVLGVPNGHAVGRGNFWTLALGPSVELPMGLRNAVLGVPKWTCGELMQGWEKEEEEGGR